MSSSTFNFKTVTVDQLETLPENIYEQLKDVYDLMVNITEERTYENTVRPLINIYDYLQPNMRSLNIVKNFFPDQQLRDVATESESRLSKLLVGLSQRKDVYECFLDYQMGAYKYERETLNKEEIKFFENSIRDFRRSGLHLDDPEIETLKKRLSDLSTEFSKNVNDEDTRFEFTKEELDGMPESWFNDSKLSDHQEGTTNPTYVITLKYPDYVPLMEYVKNPVVRKTVSQAYSNRCGDTNTKLFEETVKIRSVLARKLGYKNHSDYVTEVCVVKNSDHAYEFLTNLNEKFTELYDTELLNLTEFAKSYGPNPLTSGQLNSWDRAFYLRAYKEANLNIDMEEVKKYFPLKTVKEGLFAIYEKLLDLTFTEIETDNKWHDSVSYYRVSENSTGDTMGYFYLDMHPRTGKYSHAAIFPFQEKCDLTRNPFVDETNRDAVVIMACNFAEDSCLNFSDVVTFFHEFGHIMHQLNSKTKLSDMCSFNVETDFVEAPSQMLEYWCYEKEPLQMMSSHSETGATIPDAIIEKLSKIKNGMQGFRNKRQIMFGMFDLECHRRNFNLDSSFDSQRLWHSIALEVNKIPEIPNVNPVASFGHIMGGYDSRYYGYLRAETFAANMFHKMFKGDVLNTTMGLKYRKCICEPGSTEDGMTLLKNFLGTEPDDSYFLSEKGI